MNRARHTPTYIFKKIDTLEKEALSKRSYLGIVYAEEQPHYTPEKATTVEVCRNGNGLPAVSFWGPLLERPVHN